MPLDRKRTNAFIKDMRERLRITHKFSDREIYDLISAAFCELGLAGVALAKLTQLDKQPLIKQAVVLYLKAEFGFDIPDAAKYRESFEKLKIKLTLSDDYLTEKESGGGDVLA
ncbi:MAG: DNA-packaging protein [Oscillospiraceae bacterium]|jgi:hypothetical protein|nr:DNA-packaging protein [Oscillospiraceae bacterium]